MLVQQSSALLFAYSFIISLSAPHLHSAEGASASYSEKG